ncbi:MAG: hypothetical protein K6V97_04055 [Actinomycetia bacterium]|nr:hypothetical protein [Actinomycetes bacterium]
MIETADGWREPVPCRACRQVVGSVAYNPDTHRFEGWDPAGRLVIQDTYIDRVRRALRQVHTHDGSRA